MRGHPSPATLVRVVAAHRRDDDLTAVELSKRLGLTLRTVRLCMQVAARLGYIGQWDAKTQVRR